MTPALVNIFDDLDDDLRPVLDPAIYVELADRGDATEEARQFAFVRLAHLTMPRLLIAAVRNGAHIPTQAGRNKAKREGLHTGYPDMIVQWTGGFAALEWKDGRGKPSPAQIECLNRLHRMEHPVAVVRTVEGACRFLRGLGAPVPGVRA